MLRGRGRLIEVTSSILLGGFLILFVLVIAGAYASMFALARDVERRRVTGYQAYCSARGYTYLHVRPGGEAEYVGVVEMFRRGASHIWRHEITGPDFVAFEYLYTADLDDWGDTDREAMIKWEDGNTHRPRFAVGPKALLDRSAPLAPAPAIDFPEDPEFSKLYVVRGVDRDRVRRLFRPAVRVQLVANPGQQLAGDGPILFWWRFGGLPPPELLDAFLAAAAQVKRLFTSPAGD
jgi:hypothetical protein